jgi:integrase
MIKKLTDRTLQALRPPTSGRLAIVDAETKGLTLRVTPGGIKSWSVRYRPRGGQRQQIHTMGSYPAVGLADARRRAQAVLAAARDGRDLPAEELRAAEEGKKAAATARTVSQLAAEFVEGYAKTNHRRWKATEQLITNHILPRLGDRAAGSVRRADIVELLDHMEHEKGLGAQVNRTGTTLSAIFRFALEREIVTSNPVTGVRPRKEVERTRTLSDAELRAVWGALNEMPEPGASFVRALMLTASRRDEVRCMQWSEIDAENGLWTVPAARTKTQKDHEIPMSRQMVELLALMPRRGSFVFTTTGDKPWSGHDKIKPVLDRVSGVKGWVFHDLRRTARSRFAEMGISYEIAERLLGHAVTKIERTYNRHSYLPEKRRALQAWADRLMAIVGDGRGAGNVVELRPS